MGRSVYLVQERPPDLVDTNGSLVLSAHVHAASLHDREGGQRLLSDELAEKKLPRLAIVWADAAYTGGFRSWVRQERGWRVEVPYPIQTGSSVALRTGGETAWLPGAAEEVGCGEDVRVAGASAQAGQGLRAATGDRSGYDLLGHELHHAPQTRQRGWLKCLKKGLGKQL